MSYHTRTYKGGGADHDPRQKTWAEFHCDVCGENEDVDITGRQNSFRFNQVRLCPHCKSHGKEDRAKSIRKEIEELTATRNNIDVSIDELTAELEQLSEGISEVEG